MDEKKWAAQDSKIVGSRDITVATEYLSPDYLPPLETEVEKTSDTGWLVLLKIEPRNSHALPRFYARWDHTKQCVDIDLEGDPIERRKFKDEKQGYRGHKTKLVTEHDGPREYAIDIETPSSGPVFKGTLTLKADFAVNLSMSANAELKASATVTTPWWRR
jgi:hypothetical protein